MKLKWVSAQITPKTHLDQWHSKLTESHQMNQKQTESNNRNFGRQCVPKKMQTLVETRAPSLSAKFRGSFSWISQNPRFICRFSKPSISPWFHTLAKFFTLSFRSVVTHYRVEQEIPARKWRWRRIAAWWKEVLYIYIYAYKLVGLWRNSTAEWDPILSEVARLRSVSLSSHTLCLINWEVRMISYLMSTIVILSYFYFPSLKLL